MFGPCVDATENELDFEHSSCSCCHIESRQNIHRNNVSNKTDADFKPDVSNDKAGTLNRKIIPQNLQRFTNGPLPEQPNIEQLSDSVICVLAQNPNSFTLNGTNTYLVGTGKSRILIDTGEPGRNAKKYVKYLKEAMEMYDIETIEAIICTHLHYDHIGGVMAIYKFINKCPLFKFRTPDEEIHARHEALEEIKRKYNGNIPLSARPLEIVYEFEKMVPYQFIRHKQIFKTEGATLTAHHTPGHAADHIVLYHQEDDCLFSGDHVLGWGSTWVQHLLPYMNSLKYMLEMNPNGIYPGHGPYVEDGCARIRKYINHRQAREDQVVKVLMDQHRLKKDHDQQDIIGDGLSSMEIVKRIYDDMPEEQAAKAEANVIKILIKLQQESRIIAVEPTGTEYPEDNEEGKNVGGKEPGVAAEEFAMIWYINDKYIDSSNL